MKVFKMFNKDLTCRGYQFKPGLNTCEEANCVQNGFHAAENPLDCLSYYDWDESVCWICEAGGDIDEDGRDSKISCTELTLLTELNLQEYVKAAADYMYRHPLRPVKPRDGTVSVVNMGTGILIPDNHMKQPALVIRYRGEMPTGIITGRMKGNYITAYIRESRDFRKVLGYTVTVGNRIYAQCGEPVWARL